MSLALRESADGVLIPVRVQPRASRNAVTGLYQDALRLALTAPPVEGEANQAVVAFLADLLGMPKSRLDIVTGLKGRDKVVLVRGGELAEVTAKLAPYVG